jgi:hypothetical protein
VSSNHSSFTQDRVFPFSITQNNNLLWRYTFLINKFIYDRVNKRYGLSLSGKFSTIRFNSFNLIGDCVQTQIYLPLGIPVDIGGIPNIVPKDEKRFIYEKLLAKIPIEDILAFIIEYIKRASIFLVNALL